MPTGEAAEVPPPSRSAAPSAYARDGCGEAAGVLGAAVYCSSSRTSVCVVASKMGGVITR